MTCRHPSKAKELIVETEVVTLEMLTKQLSDAEDKLNRCGDKYIVICNGLPIKFKISMVGLSDPKTSLASEATPMAVGMATLHGKTVYLGNQNHGIPIKWRDALNYQIATTKDLIRFYKENANDVGEFVRG